MIFYKTWKASNALGLAFDKKKLSCGLGTRVGLQEFAPLLELRPEVPPVVPPAILRTPTELSLRTILYG